MAQGMGGQGILRAAVECPALSQHHLLCFAGKTGQEEVNPAQIPAPCVCVHRIMNAEGSTREMQHRSEHRRWEGGIIPTYPIDLHWGTDIQIEEEAFGADKTGLGRCGAGMLCPSAALQPRCMQMLCACPCTGGSGAALQALPSALLRSTKTLRKGGKKGKKPHSHMP